MWVHYGGLGHPNWTIFGKVLKEKYPEKFTGKEIADIAKEYGHGIKGEKSPTLQ